MADVIPLRRGDQQHATLPANVNPDERPVKVPAPQQRHELSPQQLLAYAMVMKLAKNRAEFLVLCGTIPGCEDVPGKETLNRAQLKLVRAYLDKQASHRPS